MVEPVREIRQEPADFLFFCFAARCRNSPLVVSRRSEEGLTYYRLLASTEKRSLKEDMKLASQARALALPCLVVARFVFVYTHVHILVCALRRLPPAACALWFR